MDPLGQHTQFSGVDPARRPYPIEGNWERYAFRVGNLLFLMMSDRNEPSQTVGRGTLGGNPGGVVSGETFAWWQSMVEANPEALIVSVHHYVLKDTTVASGAWEGMRQDDQGRWQSHYHRCWDQGTPQGASYLYWVDSTTDAQAFERYLAAHPGAVQLWLGGHTHTHPDDVLNGRSHIETRWVVNFVNFTFSALLGPVFGSLLVRVTGDAAARGLVHYQAAFEPLLYGVVLAIILTLFLKETGPAVRRQVPAKAIEAL